MICPDCRAAGRLLAAGAVNADYLADMHAQCPGGTWCDCQHSLATVRSPFLAAIANHDARMRAAVQAQPLVIPDMGYLS